MDTGDTFTTIGSLKIELDENSARTAAKEATRVVSETVTNAAAGSQSSAGVGVASSLLGGRGGSGFNGGPGIPRGANVGSAYPYYRPPPPPTPQEAAHITSLRGAIEGVGRRLGGVSGSILTELSKMSGAGFIAGAVGGAVAGASVLIAREFRQANQHIEDTYRAGAFSPSTQILKGQQFLGDARRSFALGEATAPFTAEVLRARTGFENSMMPYRVASSAYWSLFHTGAFTAGHWAADAGTWLAKIASYLSPMTWQLPAIIDALKKSGEANINSQFTALERAATAAGMVGGPNGQASFPPTPTMPDDPINQRFPRAFSPTPSAMPGRGMRRH